MKTLLTVFSAVLISCPVAQACDSCASDSSKQRPRYSYVEPVGGFARQLSLGGYSREPEVVLNPYLERDMSRVYVNPAYLTYYKNSLLGNIGGGELRGPSTNNNGFGQQTGAVSFEATDNWYVGGIIGYDPTRLNWVNKVAFDGGGVFPGIIRRGSMPIPDVKNAYTGMVGYMPDSTLRLGAAVTYAWNTWDSSANIITPSFRLDESLNSKAFQIRLGGAYELPSGSQLEAHTAYTVDKANDTRTFNDSADGNYSTTGNEFLFSARYLHPCGKNWTFSAIGDYSRATAEPKEDSAPLFPTTQRLRTQMFSMTHYSFGLGGQYSNRRFLVAGGLSYNFSQFKGELTDTTATTTVKTTSTGFPVLSAGVEYKINRHFTVRAGHYRTGQTTETERTTPNGTTTGTHSTPNSFVNFGGFNPTSSDGFYTLGLGYRAGGFSADATISEEALRRGLGAIGSNDNINSFGYISLGMRF